MSFSQLTQCYLAHHAAYRFLKGLFRIFIKEVGLGVVSRGTKFFVQVSTTMLSKKAVRKRVHGFEKKN